MFIRSTFVGAALLALTSSTQLAHAGGYLWLGAEFNGEGNFYRYNIETGQVDLTVTLAGGGHWNNMATDGQYLYLGNPGTDALLVRDIYTGDMVADLTYDTPLGGTREDGAHHSGTGNLWRSTFSNLLFETATDGTVLNQFTGIGSLVGLEWVDNTLYGTNYTGGAIGEITFSGQSASFATIPWTTGMATTGSIVGLAYDKQDQVLYVTTLSGQDAKLYSVTFAGGEAQATFVVDLNTVGYIAGGLIDGMGWAPPLTFSYCTAKTNSCGTLPTISGSGNPSATATSGFDVTTNNARGTKAGLLIYTDAGPAIPPTPFQGGLLCLSAPVQGTVPVFDTTGTPGNCDGSLTIDLNAFATGSLGGNPLPSLTVCGTTINCQFWARDTVANGSLLSDALEFVIRP